MSSFKCKLVLFENHWPHKKNTKKFATIWLCVIFATKWFLFV